MWGISRMVCCAVLIGAIVPSSAAASPGSEVRDARRTSISAHKGSSTGLAYFAPAVPVDMYEPDDDWPGTQISSANLPLTRTCTIDAGAIDIDTYTLVTTPGTRYRFETTGELDTIITLYTSSGEVLAWFDDKSAADFSARGFWTATAAIKSVVVEVSTGTTEEAGAYTMEIASTPASVLAAAVPRVQGANRFEVAANTARAIYGTGWKKSTGGRVTDVIVVCGEDRAMADPLAAASLAGWYEAPLLMTNTQGLPPVTAAAITSVRRANGGKVTIHVIGGTGSISPAVYAKLAALRGKGAIERIAAVDRYELAGKIADRLNSLVFARTGEHPIEVFVANGQNPAAFYDALAVSGMCYRWSAPLLLTRNTSIPESTRARLADKKKFFESYVYAVNSTKYLPAKVYNGIAATERLAHSADRYGAALQIAQWGLFSSSGSQAELVLVNKLPDALAAGTFAGARNGLMLYVPATGPSSNTATFLSQRKSAVSHATVFGGTASVTGAGLRKVASLLNSR